MKAREFLAYLVLTPAVNWKETFAHVVVFGTWLLFVSILLLAPWYLRFPAGASVIIDLYLFAFYSGSFRYFIRSGP